MNSEQPQGSKDARKLCGLLHIPFFPAFAIHPSLRHDRLTEFPPPRNPAWSWAGELYGKGVPAVTKLSLGKWEHVGWCGLLMLREELWQSGFLGQSDQLWVNTGERLLTPDFGVNSNERSSSYFIHTAKILGCLQIVESCVLPIHLFRAIILK